MSQTADSLPRRQVASDGPVSAVTQTIRPLKRRVRLADIARSWPVARVVAIRDFKLQYKQAALGPIWLVLQPLAVLAAFTVAFDGVANVDTKGVPYALFALVGVAVWTYTSAVVATGVRSQLVNMRLIQFVNLPRIAFVTATLLTSLPILLVPVAFTFVTMLAVGHEPTLAVLGLPAAIAWLFLLLWALGLGLSALNVRFRDVKALIPLFLQGGLFLTPLGYPLSAVPDNLALVLSFNPFTGVVELWRWCLLGITPEMTSIWTGLVVTAVIAFSAWQIFARLEVRFADLI